jgi:hypothetical protein
MTLPNFLVIGAGRSGTTALHAALRQHPEVFVPSEKSPNFFVSQDPLPEWEVGPVRQMQRHWISTVGHYQSLFEASSNFAARGEVSPVYLQSLHAAQRIREYCPNVKLIAILRDPSERAYAHYWGRRRDGLESRATFSEVLEQEFQRPLPQPVAFGSYLACGLYHYFLSSYDRLFPPENIKVYLHEDWLSNPTGLLQDLFQFLGVDPEFQPCNRRGAGKTGDIAHPALRQLWTASVALRTRLRPWLPRSLRDALGSAVLRQLNKPPLEPSLRVRCLSYFRQDLLRLQERLGRDLSHWLA